MNAGIKSYSSSCSSSSSSPALLFFQRGHLCCAVIQLFFSPSDCLSSCSVLFTVGIFLSLRMCVWKKRKRTSKRKKERKKSKPDLETFGERWLLSRLQICYVILKVFQRVKKTNKQTAKEHFEEMKEETPTATHGTEKYRFVSSTSMFQELKKIQLLYVSSSSATTAKRPIYSKQGAKNTGWSPLPSFFSILPLVASKREGEEKKIPPVAPPTSFLPFL